MGAGPGTLEDGTPYDVTLTFGPAAIGKGEPLYTHFKSGLIWLLDGLKGIQPPAQKAEFREIPGPDGTISGIAVHIEGPLRGTNRENFNRAFNRLLWGFRYRKSPDRPSPSEKWVTPDDKTYRDENT